MNAKTLFAATLLASLAGFASQAMAAEDIANTAARPVTRAEVLADLQVYRESGLAQAELPENAGMDSARVQQAKAKYAQLRSSAYYASLVKQYGDRAHTTDVAAAR